MLFFVLCRSYSTNSPLRKKALTSSPLNSVTCPFIFSSVGVAVTAARPLSPAPHVLLPEEAFPAWLASGARLVEGGCAWLCEVGRGEDVACARSP